MPSSSTSSPLSDASPLPTNEPDLDEEDDDVEIEDNGTGPSYRRPMISREDFERRRRRRSRSETSSTVQLRPPRDEDSDLSDLSDEEEEGEAEPEEQEQEDGVSDDDEVDESAVAKPRLMVRRRQMVLDPKTGKYGFDRSDGNSVSEQG